MAAGLYPNLHAGIHEAGLQSLNSGITTPGGYRQSLNSSNHLHVEVSKSTQNSSVRLSSASATSDKDDDDFETLDPLTLKNFSPTTMAKRKRASFGPLGSRQASVKWFRDTQALALRREGRAHPTQAYVDWFHGIISRQAAEELLNGRPVGCFLIRVSENCLGYVLSFKEEARCRHYKIEYLFDEESFQVIGESTNHISLADLINFYKRNKLQNWRGHLTVPCPQGEGECDYMDLVINFTTEEEEKLNYIINKPRLEATAPDFTDCSCEVSPSHLAPSPPITAKPPTKLPSQPELHAAPNRAPCPAPLPVAPRPGATQSPAHSVAISLNLYTKTANNSNSARPLPPKPPHKPRVVTPIEGTDSQLSQRNVSDVTSRTRGDRPLPPTPTDAKPSAGLLAPPLPAPRRRNNDYKEPKSQAEPCQ